MRTSRLKTLYYGFILSSHCILMKYLTIENVSKPPIDLQQSYYVIIPFMFFFCRSNFKSNKSPDTLQ